MVTVLWHCYNILWFLLTFVTECRWQTKVVKIPVRSVSSEAVPTLRLSSAATILPPPPGWGLKSRFRCWVLVPGMRHFLWNTGPGNAVFPIKRFRLDTARSYPMLWLAFFHWMYFRGNWRLKTAFLNFVLTRSMHYRTSGFVTIKKTSWLWFCLI